MRMLFESFLQNYIKNFEDQEKNSKLMNTMKLARLFTCWKGLTEFKKSRNGEKVKGVSKPKVTESQSSALNPHLEQEYMGLIQEFRKVNYFHSDKNLAQSSSWMEKPYSQKTSTQTVLISFSLETLKSFCLIQK